MDLQKTLSEVSPIETPSPTPLEWCYKGQNGHGRKVALTGDEDWGGMDAGAMLCRPRTRSCSAPDACGDERGRARGAGEDPAAVRYGKSTDG